MRISRKAKKELSWILLMLSCLSFSAYMIFGENGYVKLREYRDELQTLRIENRQLQQSHHTLKEKIERLESDPYELERIARERYQLARPGDIIVNLPE